MLPIRLLSGTGQAPSHVHSFIPSFTKQRTHDRDGAFHCHVQRNDEAMSAWLSEALTLAPLPRKYRFELQQSLLRLLPTTVRRRPSLCHCRCVATTVYRARRRPHATLALAPFIRNQRVDETTLSHQHCSGGGHPNRSSTLSSWPPTTPTTDNTHAPPPSTEL
jgi:hypothetical protein